MAENAVATMVTDLQAIRDGLRARMNATSAPDESDRLYLQILEITHRVQMLNALLFRQGTEALDAQVQAIEAATVEVRAAIEDQKAIAELVGAVKSVLGIVDGVIDLLS